MTMIRRSTLTTAFALGLASLLGGTGGALAQQTAPAASPPAAGREDFEPTVGQAGKDVVWVPTSETLLAKMLDMAAVTPQDFVMDLGSGDGRNIIAAAKRGARAMGVEFNPDMVAVSRRLAREAGVEARATFVQGDMYEADISKATVLALFLLPSNLDKLKDKFLALRAGTRIVLNTFTVTGWQADVTETITDDCVNWCTSLLYIVPAQVAGTWRFNGGELTLTQEFQMVSGSITTGGTGTPVEGRLRGPVLLFTVNNMNYAGQVSGDRITGTVRSGNGAERPWTAMRVSR